MKTEHDVKVNARTAAEWLKHNRKNRPWSLSTVQSYAADMVAGRWENTAESIKFNTSGDLDDGQNRLMAVIEADKLQPGITITFTVTRNHPPQAKRVLDGGKKRSAADQLGWQHPSWSHLSNRVAIAYAIYCGIHGLAKPAPTVVFRQEITGKYQAALNFIVERFPSTMKGVTIAPVLAAICRGYMQRGADHARLIEFCEVLKNPICQSRDDMAAVRLREWLLGGKSLKGGGSRNMRAYRKAQLALSKFLDREPTKTLTETERDLFPISFCYRPAAKSNGGELLRTAAK